MIEPAFSDKGGHKGIDRFHGIHVRIYTYVCTLPNTPIHLQSNLISEYTWGPSKLLLTISSTC